MFENEGNLASMSSRERVRKAHRQATPFPKERATWPLESPIGLTRIAEHPRIFTAILIALALTITLVVVL